MVEPPTSQRSATRAPVDRPIRLQFDDSLEVDEGHCINISIGGLFVHTAAPRPAGTLVRFEIMLEDRQSIRGLGEVVWKKDSDRKTPSIGIKFRFLEQRDRQLIFKLVSQHIKARLERDNQAGLSATPPEPQAPEAAAFSATGSLTMPDPGPEVSGEPEDSARSHATGGRAPAETASAQGERAPAADERAPAVGESVAQASLFDRWEETPTPEAPARQAEDLHPDGDREADAPLADPVPAPVSASPSSESGRVDRRRSRGRSRRRPGRRERGGWWLVALVLVAAAAAAYLLGDRFFSQLSSAKKVAQEDHGRMDPTQAEPAQAEPAQAESAQAEPAQAAPAQAEPAQAESAQAESAQAESAQSAAVQPPRDTADSVAEPAEAAVAKTPDGPGAAREPPSAPAEPQASTAGQAIAAGATAMSRLVDIRWRTSGEGLIVSLFADGPIDDARIKRFRLGGATVREVVVLAGMRKPFDRNLMTVGAGGLAAIRTGLHRERESEELHVVLDLADPAFRLLEVRNLGSRLELVVGPRATGEQR